MNLRARSFLLVAAATILGCSDDGGPTDNGPDPSISIVLSAATLTIDQGDNSAVALTLTRGGGYAGAVTLAVEGAPSGVVATANPASLTGTALTAQIEVTVDATVATGTYNLTVRATGTGVTASTAPLSVIVAPGPAGSFVLAVQPTSLEATQGTSAQAQVTVQRTNFPGEVTFSTGALPAGMTATFAPPSTSLLVSQLTLTIGPTTPTGDHIIEIRGDSPGQTTQTVALNVRVNAATGGGNVVWQFCSATGIPVWVAYRDGNGPWTRVQAGASNQYSFSLNTLRGAFAYVTASDGDVQLNVQYGLTPELIELGAASCDGSSVTKTINGTVAGLRPTDQASITMGSSGALVLPGNNSFTLEDVLDGPRDLIAARLEVEIEGDDFSIFPDELIIRRGIDPAPGSTLPVLDFEGQEAFEPVTREITVNNGGTDLIGVITGYFTQNGASAAFFTGLPVAGTTFTYAGVPADRQVAGDLHWLAVSAVDDLENFTRLRTAQAIFEEATDKTLTLGPQLGNVTVTEIENAPYVRLQTTFIPLIEYNRYWVSNYDQPERGASVAVTSLYAQGGPIDLSIPDFTGTDGWDAAAWALQPGIEVSWVFSAIGWSVNGGVTTSPFVEGGLVQSASAIGTITP